MGGNKTICLSHTDLFPFFSFFWDVCVCYLQLIEFTTDVVVGSCGIFLLYLKFFLFFQRYGVGEGSLAKCEDWGGSVGGLKRII